MSNIIGSKFIGSSIEVPEHKRVEFLSLDNQSIIGNAIAIIDEGVNISTSSKYGDLSPFGGNDLMSLLSSSTGGKINSGQFAIQGAQIWQSTEPLKLDFSVTFYMNDNSYKDVVVPIKNLMNLCSPMLSDKSIGGEIVSIKAGFLIPPGPNIQTILSESGFGGTLADKLYESFDNGGRGLIIIKIGNFIFNDMVITSVSPKFSTVIDETGYPVSAEVSIEATCFKICTTDYLETVFGNGIQRTVERNAVGGRTINF